MAAVAVDAVPATHQGSSATAAVGVATASALAGVCIAAPATVPGLLAYYATFAFYLATFARGVWPDRVDAVLGPLGAYVRRKALLARADLEADLRRLRAHPATAPVCAGAEECARRARAAVAGWAAGPRRKVEAKWTEHEDTAGAAMCMLRLAGRLVRLTATALLDAACEQAKTKAPSVLGYLRGAIRGIRSPTSSCKKGEEAETEEEVYEDAGLAFRDVVYLVGIAFYLLFIIQLIKRSINNVTGMQFYGACLVATCGLAVLLADWIDPPDDDDSDEPDTAGDDAADTATPEEARVAAEHEVRGSWQFMWVLIFIAFCVDAFLLHVTFGPQPVALALLAVCNLEVLNLGKEVQLAPDDDDGEGTEGAGAAGVDGAVDKWTRGAVTVFLASSVKVLMIYLVLDFFMAAISFLWVCGMADLLLAEEDSLLELLDDEISGVAEEGADEIRAAEHTDTSASEDEEEDYTLQDHCDSSEVHSNTSSSEDEEEDYTLQHRCDSSEVHTNTTLSSEDEEEDYTLQEHRDSFEVHSNTTSSEDEEEDAPEQQHCGSSEEHDEHLKEQREEEPDCSGGGSMDDGWDLVEVDPEMPVKDETGVKRKSSSLFPWK